MDFACMNLACLVLCSSQTHTNEHEKRKSIRRHLDAKGKSGDRRDIPQF
jgi:hypothetical protein